jgi:hypothetical protein
VKVIILILLFLLFLSNLSSARINEEELNKNLKETAIEEGLKQTGILENISQGLNKTNPETMENLDNTCKQTQGARNLVTILTIGSIIGLFTIPLFGIIGIGIDILAILNYLCLFSI